MFSQWISLNSSKYSYNNAYFIEDGVMGLGMEMLKNKNGQSFHGEPALIIPHSA